VAKQADKVNDKRTYRRRGDGQPRRDSRNEILAAAARVFGRSTVQGATMEEIAVEAGVRSPSIYYYFENKDAIAEELATYSVHESAVFAISVADGPGSPIERLRRLLLHHIEHLLSSPFDLWFLVGAQRAAGDAGPYLDEYGQWRQTIASLLEAAVAAGEIEPCDPGFTTQLVVGCVLAVLEYRHFELPVDAVATVEFAIRGAGFRSAATPKRPRANRTPS